MPYQLPISSIWLIIIIIYLKMLLLLLLNIFLQRCLKLEGRQSIYTYFLFYYFIYLGCVQYRIYWKTRFTPWKWIIENCFILLLLILGNTDDNINIFSRISLRLESWYQLSILIYFNFRGCHLFDNLATLFLICKKISQRRRYFRVI